MMQSHRFPELKISIKEQKMNRTCRLFDANLFNEQ